MAAPRIDLAAVLEHTELFESLSQRELEILASRTVRKLFLAEELLFSEGEPCNGLHVIASGKVRIFKTSIGGREQVLAVNGPGETVAELPVFDGGPYPATRVTVCSNSQLHSSLWPNRPQISGKSRGEQAIFSKNLYIRRKSGRHLRGAMSSHFRFASSRRACAS